MVPDTQKHIQPYQYFVLPGQRIQIVHPAGAKLILHKFQIEKKLSGEDAPMRVLSAHEIIMLEVALKKLEEG